MPNLLICEADLADREFSKFLHGIRHQVVGTNPFLPVMALSYNPPPELVKNIIGSGVDDLVPKPVSADRLIDRIKLLIEARKPFVVTTDYVSPDRRKTSDHEDTIPRVEVPNPLRAKAIGTKDIALDQKAMADAIAQINLRKLERYAVQIGVLTELIAPAYESGAFDQSVKDHVDQLMYLAEDTSRRLADWLAPRISIFPNSAIPCVPWLIPSPRAAARCRRRTSSSCLISPRPLKRPST